MTSYTNVVESPSDGSLWIGTQDSGIFRIGRNGRRLQYGVSGGQLSSDHIVYLQFDSDGVLWILDGNRSITTYKSVTGFVPYAGIENVTSLLVSDGSVIAAEEGGNIYSLRLAEEPQSLVSTGFDVLYMVPSNDGGIWLMGEQKAAFLRASGELEMGDAGAPSEVLNLIPFEFETYAENPQQSASGGGFWTVILLILALAAAASAGYFIPRFRLKRKSAESPVETAPKPEEVAPRSAPSRAPVSSEGPSPVVLPETEFSKKALSLVKKNLSNPTYGVENMSDELGISRIHLNRRLKAEMGVSPSSLLKKTRMELASKLIKEGKLSVAEISSRCGFATPSYFSTAFRDYFGVPPSDYV